MKALSVKQPWADDIMSGKKTIETRRWGPNLVTQARPLIGQEIYIHASRTWDRQRGNDYCRGMRGVLIGTVRIRSLKIYRSEIEFWNDRGGHHCNSAFYSLKEGQQIVGIVLSRPAYLPEAIPCRGSLGFFTPKRML